MINQLNAEHAIDGHILFAEGEGGLTKAQIQNRFADAEVYLHGAHVTHFQPVSQTPVLWMSSQASYSSEKALRGGIPVIWPWFGPHPTEESMPQHGFARVADWAVAETTALTDGQTRLVLTLVNDEQSRSLWPHQFELTLTVLVGAELQVDLTCRNLGADAFDAGAALHTYFHVGAINAVQVDGLDGRPYLDKVTGYDQKMQQGPITVAEEVDRVYLETDDQVVIHDQAQNRQIAVDKAGSLSTVVWNPWAEKAAAMGDFPTDGYRTMICVETTNASDDVRTIDGGESHTLTQRIGVSLSR